MVEKDLVRHTDAQIVEFKKHVDKIICKIIQIEYSENPSQFQNHSQNAKAILENKKKSVETFFKNTARKTSHKQSEQLVEKSDTTNDAILLAQISDIEIAKCRNKFKEIATGEYWKYTDFCGEYNNELFCFREIMNLSSEYDFVYEFYEKIFAKFHFQENEEYKFAYSTFEELIKNKKKIQKYHSILIEDFIKLHNELLKYKELETISEKNQLKHEIYCIMKDIEKKNLWELINENIKKRNEMLVEKFVPLYNKLSNKWFSLYDEEKFIASRLYKRSKVTREKNFIVLETITKILEEYEKENNKNIILINGLCSETDVEKSCKILLDQIFNLGLYDSATVFIYGEIRYLEVCPWCHCEEIVKEEKNFLEIMRELREKYSGYKGVQMMKDTIKKLFSLMKEEKDFKFLEKYLMAKKEKFLEDSEFLYNKIVERTQKELYLPNTNEAKKALELFKEENSLSEYFQSFLKKLDTINRLEIISVLGVCNAFNNVVNEFSNRLIMNSYSSENRLKATKTQLEAISVSLKKANNLMTKIQLKELDLYFVDENESTMCCDRII